MATFLEILLLAALGALATSVQMQRLRRWRAVSALMSGGWLWALAGFLLGPSGVGALTLQTMQALAPLIVVGLGWIALMVGMQASAPMLRALPRWCWRAALVDVALTSAIVGGGSWFALRLWPSLQSRPAALMGGTLLVCASMGWSMETRWAQAEASQRTRLLLIRAVGGLASMAALGGFASLYTLTAAKAAGVTVESAMVVVLAALGGCVGGWATRGLLRLAGDSRAEFLAVLLGVVSLAAGLGVWAGASPMLAPFALGAVVANLAGARLRSFERVVLEAEHVIAAVFATVAGALLLLPDAPAGWGLAGGVTVFRLLLKPRLARCAPWDDRASLPGRRDRRRERALSAPTLMRQSPLALALGVALAASEYSTASRLLLGVLVVAGVLSEAALLTLFRQVRATSPETERPL